MCVVLREELRVGCDISSDTHVDPSRKLEGDRITFTDIQVGSSAVYQCNASNEYGYVLANSLVNVLGKLKSA